MNQCEHYVHKVKLKYSSGVKKLLRQRMQSEVDNYVLLGTSLQFELAQVYLKAYWLTAMPNYIRIKNELEP